MPLSRDFRETVRARAAADSAFREALLQDAIQAMIDGDADECRAAIRDTVNATIGFERLGEALNRSPKSLMRMFGPDGNPTARNLLGVIRVLQSELGVHLKVRASQLAA